MVITLKKQIKILLPLILCIVISSLFIFFGKINYENIITPKFAPPKIVFPIVWSIVYFIFYYTMIKSVDYKNVYLLYIILLSLHTIWNFAFFFMGFFLVGLIVLVIIYFTSWIFVYFISQVKKTYFYLHIPYLIWLMLALYLNIGIFLLN